MVSAARAESALEYAAAVIPNKNVMAAKVENSFIARKGKSPSVLSGIVIVFISVY